MAYFYYYALLIFLIFAEYIKFLILHNTSFPKFKVKILNIVKRGFKLKGSWRQMRKGHTNYYIITNTDII